jgi:hypothetical protein
MSLFEKHEALPVSKHERNKWLRDVLSDDLEFVISGDSIVIRIEDELSIEVYDCLIRRQATILKGEGER